MPCNTRGANHKLTSNNKRRAQAKLIRIRSKVAAEKKERAKKERAKNEQTN